MSRSPDVIVVIGAARSGTKLTRDLLAEVSGAGRVPYDIPFVWNLGDRGACDDVLDPAAVTRRRRRFIRRYIGKYAAGRPPVVIEKTVGNTLRVPFVAEVFPHARFVHLVRDGVDVVESAARQWVTNPGLGYLAAKARRLPLRAVPSYGGRYAVDLWRRARGGGARLPTWGPRYPGVDRDVRDCSLLEVCARQWAHCVTRAPDDLARLDHACATVHYEDLVSRPGKTVESLLDSLGLAAAVPDVSAVARQRVRGQVGRGRASLGPDELMTVQRQAGDALARWGYRPATDDRTETRTEIADA